MRAECIITVDADEPVFLLYIVHDVDYMSLISKPELLQGDADFSSIGHSGRVKHDILWRDTFLIK